MSTWERKRPRKPKMTAERWRRERNKRDKKKRKPIFSWEPDPNARQHPNRKADPEKKRRRKEVQASRRANR